MYSVDIVAITLSFYALPLITFNHVRGEVKAYMNSYIPLETAAIFFLANLYLKQGISLEYAMVDFICMGFRRVMSANRELQNEKFLPTVGFEPGTFRLRCERAKR